MRDRNSDPFVTRLQALCDALPRVQLQLHDRQSGPLSAELLAAAPGGAKRAEVWFCGPRGLGDTLREGMQQLTPGRVRFHQEAFELR
jgi:predicted ferric reductase